MQPVDDNKGNLDLETRLAALEKAVEAQQETIPLGAIIPYAQEELPPGDRFIWADGNEKWPDAQWVPSHLRGQRVPNMGQLCT